MCLNILRLLKCDRLHRLLQPSVYLIWGFHGNQSGYSRPVYSTKRQNLVTPVFLRAENFLSKTALIDCHKAFSYADLLHYSAVLSKKVQQLYGREHLTSDRVALLCGNDSSYVIGQWAVWMAGGVVVPLCKTHPVSELEYFVTDSQCSLVFVSEEFADIGKDLAQRTNIPIKVLSTTFITSGYLPADNEWFQTDVVVKKVRRLRVKNRYDDLLMTNSYKRIPAMIVYTSGTTGRPKVNGSKDGLLLINDPVCHMWDVFSSHLFVPEVSVPSPNLLVSLCFLSAYYFFCRAACGQTQNNESYL